MIFKSIGKVREFLHSKSIDITLMYFLI